MWYHIGVFGVEPDGKSNTRTANPKNNTCALRHRFTLRGYVRPGDAGRLWKSNTMKTKDRTAAAKAAEKSGGAGASAELAKIAKGKLSRWRKATRKGERVLIDPDGRIYHGTAQEVREAALMPERRSALAQSIKFARYVSARFNYTPEERREYVRETRRDAIHAGHFDAHAGTNIPMSYELYLQLCAGARLVMGDGETIEDFFAELFRCEIEALLDVAQSETGRREIPLNRYERAALDRLRSHRLAGACP